MPTFIDIIGTWVREIRASSKAIYIDPLRLLGLLLT